MTTRRDLVGNKAGELSCRTLEQNPLVTYINHRPPSSYQCWLLITVYDDSPSILPTLPDLIGSPSRLLDDGPLFSYP